jgi:hypothetical protein
LLLLLSSPSFSSRHLHRRPLSSCCHLYRRANACLIAPLLHIGWLSLFSCRRRRCRHRHNDRRRHCCHLVVVVSLSLPPS